MEQGARRLRATRANPPGRASEEGIRRETYGAALQQFDDLMIAAAAIGPVSRPLPLYYAVLQAGKAIAAAWSDEDAPVSGHGLKQDRQREPAEWHSDVLRFPVTPDERWPGVFAAVASTLGAVRLTGTVELGALWAALPEVTPPPAGSPWPLALPVIPEYDPVRGGPSDDLGFRGTVWLRGQDIPADAAAVNQLLARYPAGAGAMALTSNGELVPRWTPRGVGVVAQWPGPEAQLRQGEPAFPDLIEAHVINRTTLYRRASEHWLIPDVGNGNDHLPHLLLWWILLLGLSLLARYQPAEWRKALDLDRSPYAHPLSELLDEALTIVPDLLYDAAVRE